ncbi:hypothetical protein IHE45_10G036000 [Dioscorea alata]|uniref:Uncharacterized protein n=1 Tax=Dioscorea alata TaxID=55571 RepID=A0ACB7VAM5_DIOAL|nr:hypothetical protein IHE45_10G036000 [Dioscorea alata]
MNKKLQLNSSSFHDKSSKNDTAWLPLWLQPHQLPAFGDYPKGEHTVSLLPWKNYVCSPENNCEKHDECLYSRDDVVSSGYRLFLSGEDNSIEENTSSENGNQSLQFKQYRTTAFAQTWWKWMVMSLSQRYHH